MVIVVIAQVQSGNFSVTSMPCDEGDQLGDSDVVLSLKSGQFESEITYQK